MSRVSYVRADHVIAIRPARGAGAPPGAAEISAAGTTAWLSADELERLRRGEVPPAPALAAFDPDALRAHLGGLGTASGWRLARVVLEVAPRFADVDWERLCGDLLCVRVAHVRSPVAEAPLQLPIRILEVDRPPDAWSIADFVRELLASHDDVADDAVQVRSCRRAEIWRVLAREPWPTADVVHLHEAAFPADGDPLRTTDPERPGTLGWFLRLAACQTRLVTLGLAAGADPGRARAIASELVARGGAAVVASTGGAEAWREFYDRLVHDGPIDLAAAQLPRPGSWAWLGGGREESLRASNVGARLGKMLDDPARSAGIPKPFREQLAELGRSWDGLMFVVHERDGLIPLARHVRGLRAAWPLAARRSRAGTKRGGGGGPDAVGPDGAIPKGVVPEPPRHLNATLWREEQAELVEIEQAGARLAPDRRVHLGLDFGPKRVRTAGDAPALEDAIRWQGDEARLEVVVTPIDFELHGAPVQELRVPRAGASDRIYFALTPRRDRPRPAAARVRFSVYHANNLLQSWLLAAVVDGGPAPLAYAAAARALQEALELDRPPPGDAGFLARPEFSAAPLSEARSRPARTLSLLANDLGGERRLTVKGTDLAISMAPAGERVAQAVKQLRAVLDGATAGETKVFYQYQRPTDERLRRDLQLLARAGWSLYKALGLDEEAHAALAGRLRGQEAIIQAVHTELRETLPWSLVYDRLFADPRTSKVNGQPIAFATCLAALPRPDGTLPFLACGGPGCELSEARAQERRDRGELPVVKESVACPLHFWGFAHRIETPPQQTRSPAETAALRVADAVENARPIAIGVGYYPFESTWADHLRALQDLPGAALRGPQQDRDDVIALLGSADLDLVYLYCHAEDGALRVGANQNGFDLITADDLDHVQWRHRPLAVMNGCGTAGWSPSSMAPLIETFARNQAGAVIGTEVRVHESLAARLGQELLRLFLAGAPVGVALLTARRRLLAERNPLGLVYTLYGASELILKAPAAP